jgi:UDP-glucose 4-epimerase
VAGKVYNVACGRRTSLLELIAGINALLGTCIEPIHGPPRAGDVLHSMADISRARDDLGYRPRVDIHEGLRRCVEYYRAGAASAPPSLVTKS